MPQGLLTTADHLKIVRNIPLFSSLTNQEKDDFLAGGTVYSYKLKDVLFRQDDPIKYLYIVTEGIVQELNRTYSGREITQDLHKAGDIICKTEMFLQRDLHQTGAIAVTDVYVLELPIQAFKKNLLKHNSVAASFLSSLAEHSFMKKLELEQKMTMTTTEILASFLRQMCKSYGFSANGFTLPFKKSLIASRLGMELETLSRALPKLKQYGITVKGSHVVFHDAVDEFLPRPVRHSSMAYMARAVH